MIAYSLVFGLTVFVVFCFPVTCLVCSCNVAVLLLLCVSVVCFCYPCTGYDLLIDSVTLTFMYRSMTAQQITIFISAISKHGATC